MIDYNDGKWHGWDSAEVPPIHPKAKIEWVLQSELERGCICDAYPQEVGKFLDFAEIVAFRVVTPYVEPKKPLEAWVLYFGDDPATVYTEPSAPTAKLAQYPRARVVHMREVIE